MYTIQSPYKLSVLNCCLVPALSSWTLVLSVKLFVMLQSSFPHSRQTSGSVSWLDLKIVEVFFVFQTFKMIHVEEVRRTQHLSSDIQPTSASWIRWIACGWKHSRSSSSVRHSRSCLSDLWDSQSNANTITVQCKEGNWKIRLENSWKHNRETTHGY